MEQKDQQVGNVELVAQYITGLEFEHIPVEAVAMARRCLMDYLASAIGGIDLPAAKSGLGLLEAFGDKEEATVIGRNKKAPVIAAVWANALLGNALDLEDGHYPSLSHPSSVVFPVAMALVEARNLSPKEFIAAVVIGYDVLGRCGALMCRRYRERTHGFGAPGVYAAAAVASRLLGLRKEDVEMALGVAGCHMAAIPVLRSIKYGAMTKGGGPWGAFSGTVAALLASQGFTGPPATLQDPFMPDDDQSARPYLMNLGSDFAITNIYFKRYPACRWAHAPLDAVHAILAKGGIQPEEVSDILIETYKEALSLEQQSPATIEGIEFSAPFCIALAVVDGEFGVNQLSSDRIKDPLVREVASKVRMAFDTELDKMFPERRPARVTITTKGGVSHTIEVLEVHGEPGSEFAQKGIVEKFHSIVSSKLGEKDTLRLFELIGGLETLPSLNEVFEFLRAFH